jgi:transposase InsO family protein
MSKALSIPLPRGWPRRVKAALLHAVGLERLALLDVRASFENSPDPRALMVAEIDRLRELVTVRDEEIRIKDARLSAIPSPRRPQYPPAERLAILLLRAKTGWNAAVTARRFLVTPKTVQSWTRRASEQGPDALVRVPVPVNRHPDFVTLLVQKLHRASPSMGRRKLADVLGRAGLVLAPSTIERMKERPLPPAPLADPPATTEDPRGKRSSTSTTTSSTTKQHVVSAKRPHHLWHVDITTIPTAPGYWVPWWPLAIILRWALSWHIALVLDHYSRALIAFRVFRKEPTAAEICSLLSRATVRAGATPCYIVSDQGTQFQNEYRAWCKQRGVRPRFGAIGQHGSIAVIERMIGSLKRECLRRILVPLSLPRVRAEIEAYRVWYNTCRPHSSLGGATPSERLSAPRRQRGRVRFEPRPKVPLAPGAKRVRKLELVVTHFRDRPHLPVVELRRAA